MKPSPIKAPEIPVVTPTKPPAEITPFDNEANGPLSPGGRSVAKSRAGTDRPPRSVAGMQFPPVEITPFDNEAIGPLSPGGRSVAKSRAGTDRPPRSVAGTQYPPVPSTRAGDSGTEPSLLSPEMRSQPFKAPSKALSSKAGSRAVSPVQTHSFAGFQPFGFGEPHKTNSVRAPSEAGFIPPIPTDNGSVFRDLQQETHNPMDFNGFHRPPSAVANRSAAPSAYGGDNHLDTMGDMKRSAVPSVAGSARTRNSRIAPSALPSHNRGPSGDGTYITQDRALSPTQSRGGQSAISRRSVPPKPDTSAQSRAHSPDDLNDYETEIVQDILSSRTPRTSIAPSMLEAAVKKSHFHDQDLCILLHAAEDEMQHEVVKRAVRKAVAARIKKLGMKSDKEVCFTDLGQRLLVFICLSYVEHKTV